MAPPEGAAFSLEHPQREKPESWGSSVPDPGAHRACGGDEGTTREVGKQLPAWERGRGAGTPPGKLQLELRQRRGMRFDCNLAGLPAPRVSKANSEGTVLFSQWAK